MCVCVNVRDGECVCVCVCVCERERERARVCVRERERVCVREREREREIDWICEKSKCFACSVTSLSCTWSYMVETCGRVEATWGRVKIGLDRDLESSCLVALHGKRCKVTVALGSQALLRLW